MKTSRMIYLTSLLFAIGCGQWRPDSTLNIVSQRTVTVSGDDPFVDMEDGTRIGVDGVSSGQSKQFKLTQYKDSNGNISVDIDNVSEPVPEGEQP